MADLDKNIIITPNVGQSGAPNIRFLAANSSVNAQTITVTALTSNDGTLMFSGNSGNLFSISSAPSSNVLIVTGSTTVTGNIYIAGTGNGVVFPDGTKQTTASSGGGTDAYARLKANTGGNGGNTIFIGWGANTNSDQQAFSIAIGDKAGYSGQNGDAIAIGNSAGYINQNQRSIAIGTMAGNTGLQQSSVAIGYLAAANLSPGYGTSVVAIGNQAGYYHGATGAIAIGSGSGGNSTLASDTYQRTYAVAIGGSAGANSQGSYAVGLGYLAGSILQGTSSVSIGRQAGTTSQSNYGVAIGYQAGNSNQGNSGVAIGLQAARFNQLSSSVAIGDNAGYQNQGQISVAIGQRAGQFYQSFNTIAIGPLSALLYQNSYAIAIGTDAGQQYQGNSAIAIGSGAGYLYQKANSIAISANGVLWANTSNALFIDPIRNEVANATTSFTQPLFYNNQTKEITYGLSYGELDDLSYVTDGLTNLFTLTYNGSNVAVSDPNQLTVSVDGALQPTFVYNTDTVWLSQVFGGYKGYTIDYQGQLRFSDAPPSGASIIVRTVTGAGPTTKKVYPFSPIDIMVGY